ncbi:MAG: indolepyruvate oxidoreductase subunit beta [Bacteroidales bacterium]|nr:indolepyruvate oxidoreductase subunit beta [Bacteroidales bacterium]
MKTDIILSGVGGQGILSIATVIGDAALNEGLHLKQAEVHGMSQRGGDVQSNLRISSEPIHSDLIPLGSANVIISLEPMEALRYMPYLAPDGWVITSSKPFINIPNYPEQELLEKELAKIKNIVLIDTAQIAADNNIARSENMVLLGGAVDAIGLPMEMILDSVKRIFASKGDTVIEQNLKAVMLGYEAKGSSL